MKDIVTELRVMAEDLNYAADVISSKLEVLDKVGLRIEKIKFSLMKNIEVPELDPPTPVLPEDKDFTKNELVTTREEFKEKLQDMKPKKKTTKRTKKSSEEQLEELKMLMAKDELTKVERNRMNNIYFRLKKKGVELPEKKDMRLKSGKYVNEKKSPGRKKEAYTLSEEVAPEPAKSEQLYNCFKEVKPGHWERDGADLTLSQARDTVKDLEMEGYKVKMQEIEKGYTYRG